MYSSGLRENGTVGRNIIYIIAKGAENMREASREVRFVKFDKRSWELFAEKVYGSFTWSPVKRPIVSRWDVVLTMVFGLLFQPRRTRIDGIFWTIAIVISRYCWKCNSSTCSGHSNPLCITEETRVVRADTKANERLSVCMCGGGGTLYVWGKRARVCACATTCHEVLYPVQLPPFCRLPTLSSLRSFPSSP